ncbi:peptidase U32 family protein [Candidatus Methanoperedens nitratireducens]|uniref:Putative enzyme n=1 Tax=Candidatus Methanoperedens nitratireducens TaxID=1392998 RepID=A0A284VRE8_9EURY|nr:peptidase U32 family protein [Candidatus Methanoperedens nitroreducens]SNQ61856.1 putative enzyme [Candidatus Methanoperedens nitroreducens]
MKLFVPSPGHINSLKELLTAKDKIYSIFMAGSPDYIGTGRSNLASPQLEDIAAQTEYAHKNGVRMELVLNSSCMGGRQLTPEGFRINHWYIEKLVDIGIDSIVVADPYLVETIARDFDVDVVVSVLAFVDSPQKAEFFAGLGAKSIVIDSNVNRHFDVLHAIRDSVDCELKLLVNEGCLYRCPFRYAHFNFFSHAFGPEPRPNVLDDYYYFKCLELRIASPELIIKSPWIRPEDIKHYKDITDVYKIGGRTHFVDWILNCVNAYHNESYDGNLMDLLDCPKDLKDLFYIPNKSLDSVLEQQWKNCKKVCKKCGYCKVLTKKVTRTYTKGGTEFESLEPWEETLAVGT